MKPFGALLSVGTVAVVIGVTAAIWPAAPGESTPRRPVTSTLTAIDGNNRTEVTGSGSPVVQPGMLPLPADDAVTCPKATVTVGSAGDLTAALSAAVPGAVIKLKDGIYRGNFTAAAAGTGDQPIFLCGSRQAVLDAGGPKEGYVLHLAGAQYWRLVGFTVSNGQKGVMGDGVVGSVIQDLHVTGTGDEAIHLRKFSTDNLVIGNQVDTTGLRRDKFGEGVYVGTAVSNWCTVTGCEPDRSDRNVISGNQISGTGSESVDIKEGTTGGVVRGNTFDGAGMTGADSWVDVKGNSWLIENNHGSNAPVDGFQTHNILDDWGDWNVFAGNTADVVANGFGYALRPVGHNVLSCGNTATNADSGLANVECQPG